MARNMMRRTPCISNPFSPSFSRFTGYDRSRYLSSTSRLHRTQQGHSEYGNSFRHRLRRALRDTKIEWRPIPIGLGIGFLGLIQFYRVRRRREAEEEEEEQSRRAAENNGDDKRPRKRGRIRPSGSWFVMSIQLDSYKNQVGIDVDWIRFKAGSGHVYLTIKGDISILGSI